MKKNYSQVIWVLVAVLVFAVLFINLSLTNASAEGGALPASLDALYPPKAQQPTFLIGMFAMATPFAGIAGDVSVGHISDAKEDFAQFKAQYAKVSTLVPEWKDHYPMEPIEALEKAFATNDPGKVMAAYGEVGKACASCHENYIVRVEQKYHWGNFKSVSVADPLLPNHQKLNFAQLMQYIDANFGGLSVSIGRKDWSTAQIQLAGFTQRFQTLTESCASCHTTSRTYYVDPVVQKMIGDLGQALADKKPDVAGALVQQIGTESCAKCHYVHFPAALAKF
jgi:cytochrome c556